MPIGPPFALEPWPSPGAAHNLRPDRPSPVLAKPARRCSGISSPWWAISRQLVRRLDHRALLGGLLLGLLVPPAAAGSRASAPSRSSLGDVCAVQMAYGVAVDSFAVQAHRVATLHSTRARIAAAAQIRLIRRLRAQPLSRVTAVKSCTRCCKRAAIRKLELAGTA
jgi:hypothetical protein